MTIKVLQTTAESYDRVVFEARQDIMGGSDIFWMTNETTDGIEEFERRSDELRAWIKRSTRGRVEVHLISPFMMYVSFYEPSDAMQFKLTFC